METREGRRGESAYDAIKAILYTTPNREARKTAWKKALEEGDPRFLEDLLLSTPREFHRSDREARVEALRRVLPEIRTDTILGIASSRYSYPNEEERILAGREYLDRIEEEVLLAGFTGQEASNRIARGYIKIGMDKRFPSPVREKAWERALEACRRFGLYELLKEIAEKEIWIEEGEQLPRHIRKRARRILMEETKKLAEKLQSI